MSSNCSPAISESIHFCTAVLPAGLLCGPVAIDLPIERLASTRIEELGRKLLLKTVIHNRITWVAVTLADGLAGLRLIKVSIPAYKLRGESAFMECQYELNKSKGIFGGAHTRSRNHHGYGGYQQQQQQQQHQQYQQHRLHSSAGVNINYEDSEDLPEYRHMHNQPHKYQQPTTQHRQPYFQAHKTDSRHEITGSGSTRNGNSRSGSSVTSYHREKLQYPYVQQKQKRQYNPEYPTLPPSPYGHSVYRGRTQTSSTSLSSSLSSSSGLGHSSSISNSGSGSSSSSSNYGGRVGASTYTGRSSYSSNTGVFSSITNSNYGRQHERDDSFADSNERNEHNREIVRGHHNEGDNDDGDDDDDDDDISHEEHVNNADEDEDQEEGEDLYAIKWYKDNEEFYRYVPKANPPKTSYRVDGVRVIEEHSDSSRVLLRGLSINSTGLYRCEISAEAPNFSSVQGEGRMDVVYLPRDGPHIKGQQFQYQIGEILNLNCTSGKSHPASHLQWFINDQPVVDGQYLVRYNDTVHRHGLITSTLGLEMTVDARHFHNGAMRVKCLASISPVLWKGGKESVLQRRPGIIDNREAMLLVRSSSMALHHHCGHNTSLMALRLLTTMAVLMKLCQLLLLHTGFT
ncbi:beaten path IV [Haematobia irritans]|uniref:beaten path IV n=1 Tax=Haematobia irritans TaxID=7368 RepID=UPI003F4FB3A2